MISTAAVFSGNARPVVIAAVPSQPVAAAAMGAEIDQVF
jgi:hypothetical protein